MISLLIFGFWFIGSYLPINHKCFRMLFAFRAFIFNPITTSKHRHEISA